VFVAFGTQRKMRMRRIILSSVASPALLYFSHYLINGTILKKRAVEHKICVLICSTNFA
jgi:hypothetical protein